MTCKSHLGRMMKGRPCALAIFLIIILALCGCKMETLPPGTVATVNGEPIRLRSVQTLMDSRVADLGIPPQPSLDEMKANYGKALALLIIQTLVRQELASRNMEPGEADIRKSMDEIQADQGKENLEKLLEDASIRQDEWENLTRDTIALNIFRDKVLLPQSKISLDEIKKYYEDHKDQFRVPETARVCFLASAEKSRLEAWCADLANLELKEPNQVQCLDARLEEIPPEWAPALKKASGPGCLDPVLENGEWRAIALLKRDPGRHIPIAQSYSLIEKTLLAQKQEEAFDHWLEQKLKTSRILVEPELAPWLAGMPAPEEIAP